jgi:hypothetical protein
LATVSWVPEESRPEDAPDLERQIEAAAPRSEVRVRREGGEWRVRALAPAGLCVRGSFGDRDVSKVVADILTEAGYPARA